METAQASFTDHLGRTIRLENVPQRIISLVPSQTEFLYAINAGQQVVGVTKFCVLPEDAKSSARVVGGTKNIHSDIIEELDPDLILANKEENDKDQILALAEKYPVWTSDVADLQAATDMMQQVGKLTGHYQRALEISIEVNRLFINMQTVIPRRVLYFIWRDPYMVAGKGTFIHHILTRSGMVNAARAKTRYPTLNTAEIRRMKPDLILLSSEPFPFKEKHLDEFRQLVPEAEIRIVDGQKFSWYGSHLLQVPEYLEKLEL